MPHFLDTKNGVSVDVSGTADSRQSIRRKDYEEKVRTSESIRLNWLDMRRWNRLERLNRKKREVRQVFRYRT